MYTMRYDTPGTSWMEGLPIGNGRLAAMVWGDTAQDVLTLNHEWLWRGTHRDKAVIPAAQHLEFVRDLLRQGKYFRATVYANLYFGGEGGFSGEPSRVDPYQPAGELRCTLADSGFVSRTLDMEHGVITTVRRQNGAQIVATAYTSVVSGVVWTAWEGEAPFAATLALARTEDEQARYAVRVTENTLTFDSVFEGGIEHRIVCTVDTDGRTVPSGDSLRVEGATYIRCITDIGTSVKGIDDELNSRSVDFAAFADDLLAHKEAFAAHMGMMDLQIAEADEVTALPIEERLKRFKAGARDNGICTLYYHYGRYLMLSSSIAGELPANLQGKWNDMIDPPWQSDYHFDINLEMNYWMTGPCGMPECSDALLRYLESFYESGAKAAKELYGCRGIWLPIQTDAWSIATPEAFGWAVWIGAAPWMAMQFWRHYEYTGDKTFLKERAYRFFVAVAEFYEDYLVEDEQGVFQIMPSQSPENHFEGSGFLPVAMSISSAMDVQLCYDALTYAIDTAEILDIDPERAARWQDMRDRLPPFGIGKDGRLLEWNEDKKEVPDELGHRHLSHLYGVYPSDLFTPQSRPEQYEAARKSLAFRLHHGGGHTGWSRAWVSCLQARFGNAAGFYEHFAALIQDFATTTFLDLHPPGWFQIDGNCGAVAAVNDALVRPVGGKVWLLQALPELWTDGSLRGLRLPGGHMLDMDWAGGKLQSAVLTLGYAQSATLCYENREETVTGAVGDTVKVY